MPTTVQDVVDAARVGYPGIPDIGAPSIAVNLFNEVHNDILARCGIQTDTETISLTADTKEYALAVTARFASTAVYVRSATAGDAVKLQSKAQEAFEADHGTYKNEASGEPDSYYIVHSSDGTVKIGFDPTPDTTTSGGYPSVVMRVGRGATLTASGNLPLGVKNHTAWIAGIQAFWARRRSLPDAAQKMAEYEAEVELLQKWRHDFQQETPSTVQPGRALHHLPRV